MKKMRLGEYLIEKGKISQVSLDVALQEQVVTGEKLGQVLVRCGLINQRELDQALTEIAPHMVSGEARRNTKLAVEFLIKTKTMIVGDTEEMVMIATLSPNAEAVRQQTQVLCGKKVEFRPVPQREIYSYLAHLQRGEETYKRHLAEEGDINRVIDALLLEAANSRASDIHIESAGEVVRVRLRIDDMLYYSQFLNPQQAPTLFSRIKGMAGLDESEKRKPQDGNFSYVVQGKTLDYRVSVMPTVHGEKAAIRVLDKEQLLRMDELGLTFLEEYIRLTVMPHGLILVCGATGSGKTTTLYSTMANLDKHGRAIVTMEDPVEYKLEFITQCEANTYVNFGFEQFPRTVLRQDPNVILVGEIRDSITANATVHLADTGHLVFSTLHTTDARQTVARMESLGVPRVNLADILKGILVLRLIRKICPSCKGAGCGECRQSGYLGRTLLSEFVAINSSADLAGILDGTKTYHTFADDAKLKVEAGVTDWAEITRVTAKDEAEIKALEAA